MKRIDVSIIMGSKSDLPTMREAANILQDFGVGFEMKVLSAHRTPKEAARHAEAVQARGVKVVIAGAGGAAALAGVLASHTTVPVIGIPIETSALKGLDSLLSTVQMPPGIPVASVAIGKSGAKNAALLAIAILALSNKALHAKLAAFRKKQTVKVRKTKVTL